MRQVGVGVFQRVAQVTHQIGLQLALAWIGALPLPGDPLFDDGRAAVLPLFKHSVDAQGRQLLIAARRRGVDRIQHTTGNRRQEALG
ncbi:hypothetical protein D3C71_1373790 [compost metagenome]